MWHEYSRYLSDPVDAHLPGVADMVGVLRQRADHTMVERPAPYDAKQAHFTQAAQALPARRIATAGDITDAVVLRATNPNLTGTIIETDGGARLVSISKPAPQLGSPAHPG